MQQMNPAKEDVAEQSYVSENKPGWNEVADLMQMHTP